MKILMVADHNYSGYPRGDSLYRGLKMNNLNTELYIKEGFFRHFKIARRVLKNDYEVLITKGIYTWFFSRPFTKKLLIHDPFISNYEALVEAKKIVPKNSLRALILYLTDKITCKYSDKVIVDTKEHIRYFAKKLRINQNKFHCVPVSINEEVFFPQKTKKNPHFTVLFYGSFIRGHGINHVLEAASQLKEVSFILAGTGPLLKKAKKIAKEKALKNVNFPGWLDQKSLSNEVAKADIILGQFDGSVEKMNRVIAIKVIEGLAAGKVVITGRSRSCLEMLKDGNDIILCNFSDSTDLAKKIINIKKNPALKRKIEKNAFKSFQKTFHPQIIGEKLKKIITKEIKNA